MPTFSTSTSTLEYIDEGKGEIIFLLHGFGEDNQVWKNQIDFLKKNYRVIAPNLNGTGNSSFLIGESISIEDYANNIYELVLFITKNTNQKVNLFGHSMGGYITLAYAKNYPNTLNSFGLIHSTAFADSTEKKQMRLRAIETIEQYGAEDFLRITIPNLFSETSKISCALQINQLIENAATFTNKALQQYYLAMMNRGDATMILRRTQLPVLFLIGEQDQAAPMKDVLQQTHLPQKASLKILENVAHMGMIEKPEEINNAIKCFLEWI